jgi:DNA mismatch endonuclease, patch repair protein
MDALVAAGWRVCTVWECALRGKGRDVEMLGDRIGRWLQGNRRKLEVRS